MLNIILLNITKAEFIKNIFYFGEPRAHTYNYHTRYNIRTARDSRKRHFYAQ